MKLVRIISVTLVAAFMLLNGTAGATERTYHGLFVKPLNNEKKADVTVVNGNENPLKLVIKDTDGTQLYSKRIAESNIVYRKRIDMSRLQFGEYVIHIVDLNSGDVLDSQQLFIEEQGLTLIQEAEAVVYDHPYYLDYDNGKLVVSYLNKQGSEVRIKIIDHLGVVVYEEDLGTGIALSRKYDMSQLKPGNYRVAVISGNETISSTLEH